MTEKQINKWLRRRFSPVGWILVSYYCLMNVMVIAAAALDMVKQTLWNLAVGDFFGDYNMEALISNGWGYIVAIAVAFLILYAWKGSAFWKDAFTREKKMTGFVFFAMVCLCMGLQLVNNIWLMLLEFLLNQADRSLMEMMEQVSGSTDSFSMFLYASLLAPISEELIFRGYVLRTFRPYGKRFSIFASALLFGLFHGNLIQTPYAFLMGLILGYLTLEYSISWACLLHLFNNLVLAEGLGRLTAGMSEMMAGAVHLTVFGIFGLISLVLLIKNRQQIADYRRSEWMDRRCVKCLLTNSGMIVLTLMMLANMVTLFLM